MLPDLLAGLAVAGLVLPEGVAYAGIAGLAPGHAVIAGIAGGLVYALAGRSRFAVVSPTSSSAAILAAAIGSLGLAADPAQRMGLAMVMVAMVGVLFLGLAALRLGNLAGFISRPVLRGFALGLAITIIIKQLPKLVGVNVASGPIWVTLGGLASPIVAWNLPSLVLGMTALIALIALRRLPQLPGAVMVIAGGIALAAMGLLAPYGIALAGPISLGAPALALPPMTLLPRLAQLAAPIALILFAESWGTIRTLALRGGDSVAANRELAALGLANLAAAAAQGMPVGAGFSAGSANAAAGAQSRVAQGAAALALLALALFAGPWIAQIPEPVLAAVVIAALTHALNPAPIRHLFVLERDPWVAVAAALGVLALGVLDGMLGAIALSLAVLLYELSHPAISELGQLDNSHDFVDLAQHPTAHRLPDLAILRPNAPLFFANAEATLAQIVARAGTAPNLVLSLEQSSDLDSTAADALGECVALLEQRGQRVTLARLHDAARGVLRRAGLAQLADNSTFSVADAAAGAQIKPAPV